jgi:DNA polymerase III alpha subunit
MNLLFVRLMVSTRSAIKGVGPAVVKELCTKGPFDSVQDFITRIDHAKVNSGGISYLVKGRAADDMMDESIADYPTRRKAFIDSYSFLRGKKIKLQEDIFKFDPLTIFLQEKEHNRAFNKHLLSDPALVTIIKNRWVALKETGRAAIPLQMGTVPILGNIKIAEGLIKKGHEREVGMILLFESSSFSRGVSKKSGRPWTKVSVNLSDGFSTIECADWDRKAALGWEKNTIVYVRGVLKQGWKTPVSIQIAEIERIE